MKLFMVNPEKCTGCHLCELACSFNKHGVFNRELSNIRVENDEDRALNVPVKCMQCDDAPCIASCVTRALFKDLETGAVLWDKDRCIRCKACVIACPFGCVSLVRKERSTNISICDLCSGQPKCIEVCREKAIDYVDENRINNKKREKTFYKVLNQKDGGMQNG
ncbi:MAG: hypothetical protein HPY66_2992 [Firmicutes bacterium]|nr:hypothetical protein [Bacillota bacterium]